MTSLQTTASECFKEPFTIDWTDLYAKLVLDINTDLITMSTWDLTGNVLAGTNSIDTPQTTIVLDGAAAIPGDVITALNTIEIDNGAIRDCRTIFIEVK